MITLYQLHWSHYVEKVRWALDYKRVAWRAVDVEPFSKRQMQHLQRKTLLDSGEQLHTVPTIHDEATGAVVVESSDILAYLERRYPAPALYPEPGPARDEMVKWLLWLDAEVGLSARRLAYTQVALEHPGLLAELFVARIARAGGADGLKARFAGVIIAGLLTQRFRFHLNREDRVFERLEQSLLFAARRLSAKHYLVGERFTAADITLAALLRPVLIVPYFADNPRLQRLFEWRDALIREHGREIHMRYETALHAVRQRRGWAMGLVSWLSEPAQESACQEIPAGSRARNDQRSVAGWPLVTGPLWYFRLKRSCALERSAYPPSASSSPAGSLSIQ